MSLSRLRRHSWAILLIIAAAFLWWTDAPRRERIERVSQVGREPTLPVPLDGGWRQLILPEHLLGSFEWITQTQHMLEADDWRVRQVEYDNAPTGRVTHAAAPYRWWLGGIAWLFFRGSSASWAEAVERASLWADPLLHLVLMASVGWFGARRFGPRAASLMVLALATLYPLAAGFLPGVPDDFALFLTLAPWCLLPVLPRLLTNPSEPAPAKALRKPATVPPPARTEIAPAPIPGYITAGLAAGGACWINVTLAVPLLLGLGFGALVAAVAHRAQPNAAPDPRFWRAWGLAGAAVVLLAYLLEYAPSHLGGWELRTVHPLYGISLLGAGELLARLTAFLQGQRPAHRGRWGFALALALVAAAAVPLAMARTGNLGFLNADLLSFRLTKEHEGVMAPHLWEWFARPGTSLALAATLAPLLWLGLIVGLAIRERKQPAAVAPVALVLGPALVALGLAGVHLRWWQLLGTILVTLIPASVVLLRRLPTPVWRLSWGTAFSVSVVLGVLQLMPRKGDTRVLSLPEVEALVERDLAQALARRLGPNRSINVLAPPSVSRALHYYGGLPGLASLSWENKDGLSVALRIVISTSREEAHALALSRGVTHIVLPSWDPFFETYTRAASVQASELFLISLNRWVVPLWLRPVPYPLPGIGGFENQSVTVFEVVDEQEPPVAMSRITEYFIEMGQLDAARAAGETLRRYPADFGAQVAQAQLQVALGDATGFSATFDHLLQRLNARGDRTLPWDRRVSLAVVLARGRRLDLARTQAERCLQLINEERLRDLTPYSLFHFLTLLESLDLTIADSALRALAPELLPSDLRARL